MMRKVLLMCALAGLAGGCSLNNVDKADYLKPYFDTAGVHGCFALYDNGRNEFTIYNKDRYLQRFPAGGTLNILTGLVGLETGKVFDEKKAGFAGDAPGADSAGESLADAFRTDDAAYFKTLAQVLGADTINNRIKAISYGNMDTRGGANLTISPDEQLGLVKRLFFDQLPFQKRTQEVMRTVMEREKTTLYTLAWTENYTSDSTGHPVGWALGWIEERNHPYFFVLNIDGDKGAGVLMRKILTQQGFFKGVM
ncbi:penicillin-binding transpeptidase domain-containing protein [Dinghuibacter silviterrae]|uniref:Beta-lactamase class D n=1 Tax=Dinghuibacter silviterrae TaxID=1539049 RepID=A0A4R8DQX8_9BACT|nr:penicillin-binding transpeptidase domain-containing protein [Dinghuibacter silviterrae]TDW99530.1 beta-lactamase class D [Dinghuibacter silviterrae]